MFAVHTCRDEHHTLLSPAAVSSLYCLVAVAIVVTIVVVVVAVVVVVVVKNSIIGLRLALCLLRQQMVFNQLYRSCLEQPPFLPLGDEQNQQVTTPFSFA